MSPNPLLPPAGAEPGSVWLLVHPAGASVGTWDGAYWNVEDDDLRPSEVTAAGYHIVDQNGAAAAITMLEAKKYKFALNYNADRVGVNIFSRDGIRRATAGEHPTSFLAAALAAVREWEGRE